MEKEIHVFTNALPNTIEYQAIQKFFKEKKNVDVTIHAVEPTNFKPPGSSKALRQNTAAECLNLTFPGTEWNETDNYFIALGYWHVKKTTVIAVKHDGEIIISDEFQRKLNTEDIVRGLDMLLQKIKSGKTLKHTHP